MARPPLPVGTWGTITRAQTAGGRWRARTQFRDFDGITRQVTAWGDTGAQSERELRARLGDRAGPSEAEIGTQTKLSELAEQWFDEIQAGDLAYRTVTRYREVLDVYVLPGIGALRISECSVPRLDAFLKTLVRTKGNATAQLSKTVLSRMLSMAVRHGALPFNPVRETGSVRGRRREPRALSIDQVRLLRQAAIDADTNEPGSVGRPRTFRLVDLVDMFLGTGARIGEVLALRWPDVNLSSEPPTVLIRGTLIRKPDGLTIQEHPKTAGSRRLLTIPGFTARMLTERLSRRTLETPSDLVFASAVGTPIDPDNVRRRWRIVRASVGLDWATPHTLRKTVATLLDGQLSTRVAAAQLGHTTTAMTFQHYVQRTSTAPDSRSVLDQLLPDPAEPDRGVSCE